MNSKAQTGEFIGNELGRGTCRDTNNLYLEFLILRQGKGVVRDTRVREELLRYTEALHGRGVKADGVVTLSRSSQGARGSAPV